MSEYTPDGWVIVKVVTSAKTFYRVFASWSNDEWRMNSGITGCYMEEDGDYYYFTGYSGSTYRCHKDSYGRMNVYNNSVLGYYIHQAPTQNFTMEIMPADIDWLKMEWGDKL